MAYSIHQIIGWMAVSQPLARIGEAKKLSQGNNAANVDLDIKLYITRKDLEYEYAQDPTSDILFSIGNYGLSLCGIYLFQAITATGGGAVTPITPVTPTSPIIPYDFTVSIVTSATAPFKAGDSSAYLGSQWVGSNILFVRNHVTQSTLDDGNGSTYYSWNSTTAILTLFNGVAVDTEAFQIFPL